MPVRKEREYRDMPMLNLANVNEKRFDTDYYVEGFAARFNEPYLLFESCGIKYFEDVDKKAFDECDMSDVIFLYNHEGRVFARNHMGKNKQPSLIVEPQEQGLFVAANLGNTEKSKSLYEDIDSGLITKMSWSFVVSEDSYNEDTNTRTILKVKKLYDVSAVSMPANQNTEINTREWCGGVAELRMQEIAARRETIKRLQLLAKM